MAPWILTAFLSFPPLAGIWVQGLRTFPPEPLTQWLLQVFGGQPFIEEQLSALRDSVQAYCFDRGFPLPKVEIQSVIQRPDSTWLVIRVEEGPPGLIHTLRFEGTARTDSAFLQHLIPPPQGLLSRAYLREVRKTLQATGFLQFRGYRIEPGPEGLTLILRLEEQGWTLFSGGFSYGSTGIQGDFTLKVHNPFGRGRHLALRYRRLQLSDQWVLVEAVDPFVSPWRLLLGFRFRHELRRPRFLRDRLDLQIGKRSWHGDYALGLGYEWVADLKAGTRERRPLVLLSLEGPSGALEAEGGADHLRATSHLRLNKTFRRTWVALTLRGFFSSDTGSVDRFPVGGAQTLRGYPEDLFWTRRALILSLEAGLLSSTSPYLFLDRGFILDTGSRPTGIGLGIRRHTAGLRLDLAVGFPWGGGLRNARLHLSLKGEVRS